MSPPSSAMLQRWVESETRRQRIRSIWAFGLLPAILTIGTMGVAWGLMSGLLVIAEGIVLASVWTRLIAVGIMVVVPHLLVGTWIGYRHGPSLPAIATVAMTPVIFFEVALYAFGGPLRTPIESPGYTVGAIFVWGIVAAAGTFIGNDGLRLIVD